MRVPIMLFPTNFGKKIKFGLLRVIGKKIGKIIEYDVEKAMLGNPEDYVISSIFSSIVWGAFFFVMVFLGLYLQFKDTTPSFFVFIIISIIFFILHIYYPKILSRKIGEEGDKYLIYALRDLWMEVSAGVPLYTALTNVSKGEYGIISKDIKDSLAEISSSEDEIRALEKLSLKTNSESFKKVIWHIIVSMRTGIGLSKSIETALNYTLMEQHRKIRDYSSSLNFFLLMFLIFAAVVPAIVTTFISILSVFGVFLITNETLAFVIFFSFFVQLSIVGLLSTFRPRIWL